MNVYVVTDRYMNGFEILATYSSIELAQAHGSCQGLAWENKQVGRRKYWTADKGARKFIIDEVQLTQ